MAITCFFGQQNMLFMHHFYRDHYFRLATENKWSNTGYFPVAESQAPLNHLIRDSSKQYNSFSEVLFKKHLFEAKGKDYYVTISPAADLQIGKDLSDTNKRRLFQNTRGIAVEVDLFKKFSFFTSFFENQARYSSFQTAHYKRAGELYPNQSNGQYSLQNASIPSAGRTKPFNNDGFDYAYAMGNLVYQPFHFLIISAGNTPQFIGHGYRSLFLSDNTAPAPNVHVNASFLSKFEIDVSRSRLINLIRKPVSTSVEAYYESKALSTFYFTYKPTSQLRISLFDGVIWSKGDSIVSKRAHPLAYVPLPLLGELILDNNEVNSIQGLNLSWQLKNNLFYGQWAIGQLSFNHQAWQLGYRGYDLFGLKNVMIQLEYNHVGNGMYASENERLNYSHFNHALAHVKGNGFDEFIVRSTYEYKRIYGELKSVFYHLNDYKSGALLPVQRTEPLLNGSVFNNTLELGYRANRRMNLCVFVNWTLRNEVTNVNKANNLVFMGLRTGIFNQYTDF
jgi:hypothetical protein